MMKCAHGSEVCEPCAYERGIRKALEVLQFWKPVDNRGCSDEACCGRPPDAEAAFDNVINDLEAHLEDIKEDYNNGPQ